MAPGGSTGDATATTSTPHPMFVAYNKSLQSQNSNRAKHMRQQTTVPAPPPPPPPPPRRASQPSPDNCTAAGAAHHTPAEEPCDNSATVMVIPWMPTEGHAGRNPHDLAVYTTAEDAAAAAATKYCGVAAAAAAPVPASTSSSWLPAMLLGGGFEQQQQQQYLAGSAASSSSASQLHQLWSSALHHQQSMSSTVTSPGTMAFANALPAATCSAPLLPVPPMSASPFSAMAGGVIASSSAASTSSTVHCQLYAQPANTNQYLQQQQQQQMVVLGQQQQQHSGSLDGSQSSCMSVMAFQTGSNAVLQQYYSSPSSNMDMSSSQLVLAQTQLAAGTATAALPGQQVTVNPESGVSSPVVPVITEHDSLLQLPQVPAPARPADQALQAIDHQLSHLLRLRQQISDTTETVNAWEHLHTGAGPTMDLTDQATAIPLLYGSTVAPQQSQNIEGTMSRSGSNYASSLTSQSTQITSMSPVHNSAPVVMLTQQQQQQPPVTLRGHATSQTAAPAAASGVQLVGLPAEQVQARLHELHEAQLMRQQLRAELLRLLPV